MFKKMLLAFLFFQFFIGISAPSYAGVTLFRQVEFLLEVAEFEKKLAANPCVKANLGSGFEADSIVPTLGLVLYASLGYTKDDPEGHKRTRNSAIASEKKALGIRRLKKAQFVLTALKKAGSQSALHPQGGALEEKLLKNLSPAESSAISELKLADETFLETAERLRQIEQKGLVALDPSYAEALEKGFALVQEELKKAIDACPKAEPMVPTLVLEQESPSTPAHQESGANPTLQQMEAKSEFWSP